MAHAKDYLLFLENIRLDLSIDKSSISQVELYRSSKNKKVKGKKDSIVAMIKVTKTELVIEVFKNTHSIARCRCKNHFR